MKYRENGARFMTFIS